MDSTALKASFLVLVRQDTALLKRVRMNDAPYGTTSQVRFYSAEPGAWLSLEFLPNGKIVVVRYEGIAPMEYVNAYSIQDAYKQVRYFSNKTRLKDAEVL